jgi:hypothetical protein
VSGAGENSFSFFSVEEAKGGRRPGPAKQTQEKAIKRTIRHHIAGFASSPLQTFMKLVQ